MTPTDLVFPFFLFAVGNAFAFVIPSLQQAGPSAFWRKVSKRALLIFLIGLLLNWFPFVRWDHDVLVVKGWTWINAKGELTGIRIVGVLQRIALCYFFAAIIVYFSKARTALIISIILLIVYWILCAVFGSGPDPYSLQGYFGTAVDKAAFGEAHMYHGEGMAFDPEGLTSTISAITNVVFGYFAGSYIRRQGKTFDMLSHLLLAAFALLVLGWCWNGFFPVNKKIWTSSYVLVSTGLALASLAALIYIVEFRAHRGVWTRFFDIFGKNPLFIFVLSGLVPRALGLIRIAAGLTPEGHTKWTTPLGWFYEHICKPVTGAYEPNSSLLYAICLVLCYWLLGLWLDRKKIYIRV